MAGKRSCPTCGQSVNIREIALYAGMVRALAAVYKWCQEKNRHEFQRKDIKHLLTDDGQIARFGDWVFFGGLVYKQGKGHYGLNIERCREYFSNKLAIPTVVYKDPINDSLTFDKKRTIKETPQLKEFLNSNFEFIAQYQDEPQGTLFELPTTRPQRRRVDLG